MCSVREASGTITWAGNQVLESVIPVEVLVRYLETIQSEEGDFIVYLFGEQIIQTWWLTELNKNDDLCRLRGTLHMQPAPKHIRFPLIVAETLWSRRIEINEKNETQNYWQAKVKLRGYSVFNKGYYRPECFQKHPKYLTPLQGADTGGEKPSLPQHCKWRKK